MRKIFLIAGLLAALAMPATGQVRSVSIRMEGTGTGAGLMGEDANQKELDKAYLECIYEYKYLTDTTDLEKVSEEMMVLQIGNSISKFFSDKTRKAEEEIKAQMVPGRAIQVEGRFMPGESYQIYKERGSGKLIFTDKIMAERFRYEEPLGEQQWTMSDQTREILGYECQRADCDFRGRHYTAWFTTDVPVDDGPWKFNGLPGLIMAVADEGGHYSFEMTGITRVEDEPIMYPEVQYHKTKRKDYLKTLYKSKTDPIGYLQNNTNMKIQISAADGGTLGNTVREMKYDFMERDYR